MGHNAWSWAIEKFSGYAWVHLLEKDTDKLAYKVTL